MSTTFVPGEGFAPRRWTAGEPCTLSVVVVIVAIFHVAALRAPKSQVTPVRFANVLEAPLKAETPKAI